MDQRSHEWYEARRGKLTASRMARLMSGTFSSINTLLDILEREIDEGEGGWLEGRDIDASAMLWGRDNEPRAIALYEMLRDVDVRETGLIYCPDNDFIGASPDGVIDSENISLEVKCPKDQKNHELALIYGMPKEHYWQTQTQSLCLKNKGVVFVSYDPRQRPRKRLFTEFQPADPEAHQSILEKADWFHRLLIKNERLERIPTATPQFF